MIEPTILLLIQSNLVLSEAREKFNTKPTRPVKMTAGRFNKTIKIKNCYIPIIYLYIYKCW